MAISKRLFFLGLFFILGIFFLLLFLGKISAELTGVSLISPENGVVIDSSFVNFSCRASEAEPIEGGIIFNLYINGSLISSIGGDSNAQFVWSADGEGYYSWYCVACQGSSCRTSTTRYFSIYMPGPRYSQNSTTFINPTLTSKLFLEDNYGLSGYSFFFDECSGYFVEEQWQPLSGNSVWINKSTSIDNRDGCFVRWKVSSNNTKDFWNTSEYSYFLPDITPPNVSQTFPSQEGFFNSTSVPFNCSATDNFLLSNISLYGNWSGSWVRSDTNSVGGKSGSTTFLKTLTSGVLYSWNCVACDSYGMCVFGSSNRTIFVDVVNPSIILVSPANGINTNTTLQTFQFNVTDNTGINNCSLYIDDALKQTKSPITMNSITSFSSTYLMGSIEGFNHSWYVRCYDRAGNLHSSTSRNLIIVSSGTTTEEESQNFSWSSTYLFSLVEGNTIQLSKFERVKIIIGGANHYVGIVDLTNSTAKINVSSTSQQAIFNVGDEKKFEVTDDYYYDLLVKLNSISNNKANITINFIHEKTPYSSEEEREEFFEETAENTTEETSRDDSSQKTSLFDKIFSKETTEEGGKKISAQSRSNGFLGNLIWIFFILLIVGILGVLSYCLIRRKKSKLCPFIQTPPAPEHLG